MAKRSYGTGERFTVAKDPKRTSVTKAMAKMDPTIKLIRFGPEKQATSGNGNRCWPSHHHGVKSSLNLYENEYKPFIKRRTPYPAMKRTCRTRLWARVSATRVVLLGEFFLYRVQYTDAVIPKRTKVTPTAAQKAG